MLVLLPPPPEDLGKPGSDAGMPGIEDSEVGKIDDVQFGESAGLEVSATRLVQGSQFMTNGSPPFISFFLCLAPSTSPSLRPALKRPAITQDHVLAPDPEAEAGDRVRAGVDDGAVRPVVLEVPDLQAERDRVLVVPPAGHPLQQQPPPAVADRPVLFDEDNKAAAIQADELGEQNRQLQGKHTHTAHVHTQTTSRYKHTRLNCTVLYSTVSIYSAL